MDGEDDDDAFSDVEEEFVTSVEGDDEPVHAVPTENMFSYLSSKLFYTIASTSGLRDTPLPLLLGLAFPVVAYSIGFAFFPREDGVNGDSSTNMHQAPAGAL